MSDVYGVIWGALVLICGVVDSTDHLRAFGRREDVPVPLQDEWNAAWVPEHMQRAEWARIKLDAARTPDDARAARAFLRPLFREFRSVHDGIRDVLGRAAAALNAADAPYSAASGTLLGIMRDGDVLPFDTDADIALAAPDGFAALAATLGAPGGEVPRDGAKVYADGGKLVAESGRYGLKALRYGTQWKLLRAGPGIGVGIDVWPVYRDPKRQQGRAALGFGRQGPHVAQENPRHDELRRGINLTVPSRAGHGGGGGRRAFVIKVPRHGAALRNLVALYGDDCMSRVNVWNSELNNEHLDPRHNKRRWSFSAELFHRLWREWNSQPNS